jgi:hypothetical protein
VAAAAAAAPLAHCCMQAPPARVSAVRVLGVVHWGVASPFCVRVPCLTNASQSSKS